MKHKHNEWIKSLALLAAMMAVTAGAQPPEEAKSMAGRLSGLITGPAGMAIIAVVLLALIGLIMIVLMNRRRLDPIESGMYFEQNVESSKYEQLKAEIQGLYLRVQGGESKGYYRKIEQLARIYIERAGHPGARQMSEVQIQTLLDSGVLPQNQSITLNSIITRCRQGAEHESQKLDFTPGELLKDLSHLVKQTEETPIQTPS